MKRFYFRAKLLQGAIRSAKKCVFLGLIGIVPISCSSGGGGGEPTPEARTVSVRSSVTGGGAITPSTAELTQGQSKEFKIVPDQDYKLSSIEGCNGTLDGNIYAVVSLYNDCVLTANFIPSSFFNVTLSVGEGGTVDITNREFLASGDLEVGLTPDFGYVIDTVSGCNGELQGSTYRVESLSEDCAITATFSLGSILSVEGSPIKGLLFSWGDTPNATHYKLFEDPDGDSGYSQIGSNFEPSTGRYLHVVPLHLRTNARYQLQVCTGESCEIANTISVNNDALIESIGYIKASNPDDLDLFGINVVVSNDGNTIAVTSMNESSSSTGVDGDQSDNSVMDAGAVYVFAKVESEWVQQGYLKASNTDENDFFGSALDLSADGSVLVVGARNEQSNSTEINAGESDNSGISTGAVYVFSREGGSWTQQAYLKAIKAPRPSYVLDFGRSVSLDAEGKILAVGSLYDVDDSNGPVHIFERSGDIWSFKQMVAVPESSDFDDNGRAVKLSNDGKTLVVGAPGEDSSATGVNGDESDNSVTNAGAVYVYEYIDGEWLKQAYLKSIKPQEYMSFGSVLSISGDGLTVAVGVSSDSSSAIGAQAPNSLRASGAVYIYKKNGSSWSFLQMLKASNTVEDDRFGNALCLNQDGSLLFVGAIGEGGIGQGFDRLETSYNGENSGAVFVYKMNGQEYQESVYVKAKNSYKNFTFGDSVGCDQSGNVLAVGAAREDSISAGIGGNDSILNDSNSGAVYLY